MYNTLWFTQQFLLAYLNFVKTLCGKLLFIVKTKQPLTFSSLKIYLFITLIWLYFSISLLGISKSFFYFAPFSSKTFDRFLELNKFSQPTPSMLMFKSFFPHYLLTSSPWNIFIFVLSLSSLLLLLLTMLDIQL